MDKAEVQSIVAEIFNVAGVTSDDLTAHDDERYRIISAPSLPLQVSDDQVARIMGGNRMDSIEKTLKRSGKTSRSGHHSSADIAEWVEKMGDSLEEVAAQKKQMLEKADGYSEERRARFLETVEKMLGQPAALKGYSELIADKLSDVKPGAISSEQVLHIVEEHFNPDPS